MDAMVTLPESRSAEAALLGSMILDPRSIPDFGDVTDEMFFHDEHRILARIIRQIYERHHGGGQAVDGVLVRNELEASKQLDKVGGLDYLQKILDTVPTSASAAYYARIVRAKALRRMAIVTGREMIEAALAAVVDDEDAILEAVMAPVSQVHQAFTPKAASADMLTLLQQAFGQLENAGACRIQSPWWALAKHVAGFKPGQMIVIAGRPAMGKSAFALSLALANCKQEARILFVSFEMSALEITNRMMSAVAEVPHWRFENPERDLAARDWKAITESLGAISQYDLQIYDQLKPTPIVVKNACRAAHHKQPLDAIFVDYIQRMHTAEKRATRDWEMSVISNELKNLARELSVPVFVLSQLNRQVENREDKHPRPSDLRDSGTLEQDADVILGLYREDEYKRDKPGYTTTNLAEILVLKQRNGAAHVAANLHFYPGTMTFHNRAADDIEAENDQTTMF